MKTEQKAGKCHKCGAELEYNTGGELCDDFVAYNTVPFPSLIEYAKEKLPPSVANQITEESQVESFRKQWEIDRC